MKRLLLIPAVFFCIAGYGQELDNIFQWPDNFDGKTVTLRGEVIGDVLRSGKGAWINILNRSTGIGLFASDPKIFDKIIYRGGYRFSGDQVLAQGVFYKNCPIHGEADIHLTGLEVIEPGKVRIEGSNERLADTIPGAFIALLVSAYIFLRSRKNNTIKQEYAARNRKAKKRV